MIVPDSLYQKIIQCMPIPCVDLLVVNSTGGILLVQRRNPPAEGQWWFPGGRIWFGEKRADAAVRKLKEECGLDAADIDCLGTYDLMLGRSGDGTRSHAITSLYRVGVHQDEPVCLDDQSKAAMWMTAAKWLQTPLHPFVAKRLAAYARKASYANGSADA